MNPVAGSPASYPAGPHELPPRPPVPTDDPFIDEIRAIKYELAARFDYDIERLGGHLKLLQEEIGQSNPQRIIRQPKHEQ